MKRLPVKTARAAVALAAFVSVVVGLAIGDGWGTLSSMGYDAVAYLCPLGALETFLADRSMVPRAVVALVVGIGVAALVGRAFCAWVCPVPPIQRFFRPKPKADDGADAASGAQAPSRGEAGEGAGVASACAASGGAGCASCGLAPVGGKRDGLHIDSRHGVLAGALLSSAVFGFPVFCLVCPVGLSIALVVAVYQAVFQQSPTVSLVAFAGILLVELVFFRRWCHRLCPMGALMSLVGAKAPLGKPKVDEAKCLRTRGLDCTACVGACPEQLDPHTADIPECTRCAVCAEVCPAHAVSLGKLPGVASSQRGQLSAETPIAPTDEGQSRASGSDGGTPNNVPHSPKAGS